MNAAEFFPSKFLKAADLPATPLIVTIAGVGSEAFGEGRDIQRKLVLTFKDQPLGMVVNKTNFTMLREITGSANTDAWIGQRVQLVAARVDFQGKRVLAIRIEPVATTGAAAVPADAIF